MTFACHLCGHEHDRRDEMLGVPNVCGWCGDGQGIYAGGDPANVPEGIG